MNLQKLVLLLFLAVISVFETSLAQENKKYIEVLYFKANLACCKARACNALQADVDSVLIKYFANENIEFKAIRLADSANIDLVSKYNAKSQTVIIVTKIGQDESSVDVSAIVKDYARTSNKMKFEEEMKKSIAEAIK